MGNMKTETSLKADPDKTEDFSKIKLELLSGPMDGIQFEITKDIVTIGREENIDISLRFDILVSRLHAKISFENGEYWLEDIGSKNGTFIGEKKVKGNERLPLKTIFRVGATEMRLIDCELKAEC